MSDHSNVFPLRLPGDIDDPLTDVLRSGYRAQKHDPEGLALTSRRGGSLAGIRVGGGARDLPCPAKSRRFDWRCPLSDRSISWASWSELILCQLLSFDIEWASDVEGPASRVPRARPTLGLLLAGNEMGQRGLEQRYRRL